MLFNKDIRHNTYAFKDVCKFSLSRHKDKKPNVLTEKKHINCIPRASKRYGITNVNTLSLDTRHFFFFLSFLQLQIHLIISYCFFFYFFFHSFFLCVVPASSSLLCFFLLSFFVIISYCMQSSSCTRLLFLSFRVCGLIK